MRNRIRHLAACSAQAMKCFWNIWSKKLESVYLKQCLGYSSKNKLFRTAICIPQVRRAAGVSICICLSAHSVLLSRLNLCGLALVLVVRFRDCAPPSFLILPWKKCQMSIFLTVLWGGYFLFIASLLQLASALARYLRQMTQVGYRPQLTYHISL